MLILRQRRAVVGLAAASRDNRDRRRVGGDTQRAVSGSDVCILILMLDCEIVAVVVRAVVAESRDPAARRSDRQGVADRQLKLQAVAARHRVDACAVVSHRVFRLRVRVAVIHPAAVGGGDCNRCCVGGDFQRVFGLEDVVVGSCRVLFQGIVEGVRAFADYCLAAGEGVGCPLFTDPAGLHRQAVGILAVHLIVRQCQAVVLAGLAAAGQGHLFGKNGQRANRICVNIGEIGGNSVAFRVEDVERGHRIHGLLAHAGNHIRHRAVGGGGPGEAFGNACHGEVVVLILRQRCAVVNLACAAGDNLDEGVIYRYRQRPGVVVNRIAGGLVDGGVVRGGDFCIAGGVFA